MSPRGPRFHLSSWTAGVCHHTHPAIFFLHCGGGSAKPGALPSELHPSPAQGFPRHKAWLHRGEKWEPASRSTQAGRAVIPNTPTGTLNYRPGRGKGEPFQARDEPDVLLRVREAECWMGRAGSEANPA